MARSTSQRRQQKLLHYIGPRNSFAVFERLNKSSRPTPFGGILKCNWRAAANSRCTLTYTLAAQTSCRHTFDGGGREFNSCSLVRETRWVKIWTRVPGSTPTPPNPKSDTRWTYAEFNCQRPYCVESTRSHSNSEVKLRKARSVLGWGTAWEALRVLLTFFHKGFQKVRAATRSHRKKIPSHFSFENEN
jgi:hypothetical protein